MPDIAPSTKLQNEPANTELQKEPEKVSRARQILNGFGNISKALGVGIVCSAIAYAGTVIATTLYSVGSAVMAAAFTMTCFSLPYIYGHFILGVGQILNNERMINHAQPISNLGGRIAGDVFYSVNIAAQFCGSVKNALFGSKKRPSAELDLSNEIKAVENTPTNNPLAVNTNLAAAQVESDFETQNEVNQPAVSSVSVSSETKPETPTNHARRFSTASIPVSSETEPVTPTNHARRVSTSSIPVSSETEPVTPKHTDQLTTQSLTRAESPIRI